MCYCCCLLRRVPQDMLRRARSRARRSRLWSPQCQPDLGAQEDLAQLYGVAEAKGGALKRHRALGDVQELARLLPHLQARPRMQARTACSLLWLF